MIETNPQASPPTVRDPICGMTIDPAKAFATRTEGLETLYFCSKRCVQQYDCEHTSSATTGVSDSGHLRCIELVVTNQGGRHGATHLEEQLLALPGVQRAWANAKTNLVRVVYAPSQVQIDTMVGRIRAVGYTVGTATMLLDIQDLHCASCVVSIEKALRQTRGVLKATVNPATQQASIEYMPGLIDRTGLAKAVEEAGYRVCTPEAPSGTTIDRAEQDWAREYRMLLRKFWFAAAISVPVIIFSYPQFFPGLRDWLADGSAALRLAWAFLGVLTLPVMFWAGSHYFSGMWQALKHRQATMYTLIAIGVSAAWLYSSVAVVAAQLFPSQALTQTFYDVTAVV